VVYLLSQSGVLIVQLGIRARCHTLEDLAESLLGPLGFMWVASTMTAFAFGGMTAYIVILGDVLPPVLQTFIPSSMSFLYSREIAVAVFSTVIILPLCLMRSMASLATASTLSVLADAVLIIIVLAAGPSEASQQDVDRGYSLKEFTSAKQGMFAGIGAMSFAFVCHHNALIVFQSLRDCDRRLVRWRRVVFAAEGIALCLSLTLGIGGCVIFGPQVAGDIINEFESTGAAVTLAKVLLAACMVLTHPVECFIARHSILSIINRCRRAKRRKAENNRMLWSPLQFYRNRKRRYDRLSLSRHAPTGGGFEAELRGGGSPGGETDGDVEGIKSPIQLFASHDERMLHRGGGLGYDDLGVRSGRRGEDEEVSVDLTQRPSASPNDRASTIVNEASSASLPQNQIDIEDDPNDFVFAALTITLWGLSTYLALVYTDLALVLSFVGCVTAAMVGYIIPSALFFASYRSEVSAWLQHIFGGWRSDSGCKVPPSTPRPPLVVPALLGVFGVSVMAIGLATLLS
jgi:amino acid permease